MSGGIVIIGASHAGVQVATSLRDFGYEGIITLINGEAAYPYQRPPLSKAVLYGGADVESLSFRSPTYYLGEIYQTLFVFALLKMLCV